jgi:hypothetical protein
MPSFPERLPSMHEHSRHYYWRSSAGLGRSFFPGGTGGASGWFSLKSPLLTTQTPFGILVLPVVAREVSMFDIATERELRMNS